MIKKSGRCVAYESARSARPRRVLPLAIGAVVATLSFAAVAGEVSRDLSKGRYAGEILKDAVDKSKFELPRV